MQLSAGAVVLFAGMVLLLGLLVAYASGGVGQRAHQGILRSRPAIPRWSGRSLRPSAC